MMRKSKQWCITTGASCNSRFQIKIGPMKPTVGFLPHYEDLCGVSWIDMRTDCCSRLAEQYLLVFFVITRWFEYGSPFEYALSKRLQMAVDLNTKYT